MLPHLPRCPASLAMVVASVLADPHPTVVDIGEVNGTAAPHKYTAAVYTATVTMNGPQMADFGVLMQVACDHRHFVWSDPADGVDKVVAFEQIPEVLPMKAPHRASPDNVFTVRLSIRYDTAQAHAPPHEGPAK